MMAAPFLALFISLGLAWKGKQHWSLVLLVIALALSVIVFLMHATDPLEVSL